MNNKELLRFEKLDAKNSLMISKWGFHRNPLFFDYNIKIRDQIDADLFAKSKQFPPFRKYYAIIYEDFMEGFIGLKKINYFSRSSELGLVLNPSVVGQGLGTLALKEFLKVYFNQDKMNTMYLEVANFNIRAQRLYEKLGFESYKVHEAVFSYGSMDFTNPYMLGMEKYFSKRMGRWYYKVISMKLKREDFNEIFH